MFSHHSRTVVFLTVFARVEQSPFTFWSVALSLLVGYQATLLPFEEDN